MGVVGEPVIEVVVLRIRADGMDGFVDSLEFSFGYDV